MIIKGIVFGQTFARAKSISAHREGAQEKQFANSRKGGLLMADNVNHPAHYETGKFECIDVMVEVFGAEKVAAFYECNAFKYLYRCENKHETPQEDWKKARWYLNKALELTGQETVEKPLAAGGFITESIVGRGQNHDFNRLG